MKHRDVTNRARAIDQRVIFAYLLYVFTPKQHNVYGREFSHQIKVLAEKNARHCNKITPKNTTPRDDAAQSRPV